MNKIPIIFTPKLISLIIKGKHYFVSKDEAEKYNKIKELARSGDYDEIEKLLLEKVEKIKTYIQGQFEVTENGQIYDRETSSIVSPLLSKRLLEWQEESLPITPLVNFHRNSIQNPNYESFKDLYDFIEANAIPITDDGCFIAYKKVTKIGHNLYDSRTLTILNNVGEIVEMDRPKVDSDRNATCSTGLHVGAFEYVSKFIGDTTILVKVNPKDVVAVPIDYEKQKMRCCKYEVISIYGDKNQIESKYITTTEKAPKTQENNQETIKEATGLNNEFVLPEYSQTNKKELVEIAEKYFKLKNLTESQKRKERLYKKLENLLKEKKNG